MTTFYPTWEEANRHSHHGQDVHMGPDGNGHAMYYVADREPVEATEVPATSAGTLTERTDILIGMIHGWSNVETETSRSDSESTVEIRQFANPDSAYATKVISVRLEANTTDVYLRTGNGGAWFEPMEALTLIFHELTH